MDMKTIFHSTGVSVFAFFIFLLVFLDSSLIVSSAPNDLPQVECALNFTTYPLVASFGECWNVQENISSWTADGFPATMCCRNALTALSEALALHNHSLHGPLFVSPRQWQNCSTLFYSQYKIPAHSCGFDALFMDKEIYHCSNLAMQDVASMPQYQDTLNQCSHFDQPFVEACPDCTTAILSLRDALNGGNGDGADRAVCGVAALVAVMGGKQNDPSLADKFLRCLPPISVKKSKYSASLVLISVPVVVVVLLLIALLIKYTYKKKKQPLRPFQLKEITSWAGLYCFTKQEIEKAMNYGDEKICLGRGSAGQVYRGVLPSGQLVAIKHLTKSSPSDSFTREIQGLSRLRHPNLVCLFGCCIEGDEKYLVYEFCANGNLAQHLLKKDCHLNWETRVKILRDCSFALKYLHHHIEGCVVHRDIKLTNILLTEEYQAKLSDFGLARMMGVEESKVFTDIRGTIGYMDPEYMSNAKLTCASDVYSFGIVALQILSGQKVIEMDLDARDQLTRKARDVSMGKRPLRDFEDPRLGGEVNKANFESILHIAVLCVAKHGKSRPTIEVIFDELDAVYKDTCLRISAAKQDNNKRPPSSSTPSTSSSSKSPKQISV
ncbi:serine/threonine-protein kinase CDG1-like [Arachis stenosperma]|uniref:serine/threonine-protein kinase CDG1-like n=1 Tax=Arachis stenosperma TaxID=217475 RepID=UPI0025ACFF91|nr:serine/threonine-protein kinase CDG1-like [Arachis stenosperma]